MKAVCWCGTGKVHVENVPDPRILAARDAIVRITATTICGSDLHLYDGYVPGMLPGDILGHEIVGEVVEVGPEVKKLHIGDRVVVVSVIACGQCWYCQTQQFALCDNSNPNAWLQEKMHGYAGAGVFGFSHIFGGYAGAQAEYVRVPFADVGAFVLPHGMSDEQGLACSDIFPTGFMGADNCELRGGEIVAVWGCGPVGLMAIKSAYLLGAEQVIAIDNLPERLRLAGEICGATTINHDDVNVPDALRFLTGGRGPDACIDAVGMEAHGANLLEDMIDRAKVKTFLQTERLAVIRQMISCCRKGGTISLLGVYAGMADQIPLGVAFVKDLRIHMGNMHGQRYVPRLFDYWRAGKIDPAFVYSHRLPLRLAPEAYRMFRDKRDECVKILLQP
jgi:threonine dehydrogenase-like Zn-dependent dehydrogenase